MIAETLAAEIIKEQSLIIGETLAKQRAQDTGTIAFGSTKIDDITFTQQNPPLVIEGLVNSYGELFGRASVEVCLEVLKKHPFVEISPFLSDTLRKEVGH